MLSKNKGKNSCIATVPCIQFIKEVNTNSKECDDINLKQTNRRTNEICVGMTLISFLQFGLI